MAELRLIFDAAGQRWEGVILPIDQWAVLDAYGDLLSVAYSESGALAGFVFDLDPTNAGFGAALDQIRDLFGDIVAAGPAVATLHRGFDPVRGWRAMVRFVADPTVPVARQRISATLRLEGSTTRDNFEGVALTRSPSGGTRLYLISDDNAAESQRTLLLAFDWVPPPPPPALPPKPAKKPVRKR